MPVLWSLMRRDNLRGEVLSAGKSQAFLIFAGSMFNAAELMQNRSPVGAGPSSNTCPRCAPQRLHITSVRRIPWLVSVSNFTLFAASGAQKLGHPVPDSNFSLEVKSGCPQQTHTKVPGSCESQYLPVKGGSVPFSRVT